MSITSQEAEVASCLLNLGKVLASNESAQRSRSQESSDSTPTNEKKREPDFITDDSTLCSTSSCSNDCVNGVNRHSRESSISSDPHDEELSDSSPRTQKAPHTSSKNIGIPFALMNMLTDDRYNKHLYFLPDNKMFVLTPSFATSLMAERFQMTNFGAFIRILKRWGFLQINNNDRLIEPGAVIISHPLFQKGDWIALNQMRYNPSRQSSPTTRKKRPRRSLSLPAPHPAGHRTRSNSSTGHTTAENELSSDDSVNIRNRSALRRASTGGNIHTIQNTINRNIDLSNSMQGHLSALTESASFSVNSSYRNLSTNMTQSDINNTTKEIVAAAIQCLHHDENNPFAVSPSSTSTQSLDPLPPMITNTRLNTAMSRKMLLNQHAAFVSQFPLLATTRGTNFLNVGQRSEFLIEHFERNQTHGQEKEKDPL